MKNLFFLVFLMLLSALYSCQEVDEADTVYYNGVIITMTGEDQLVEALAVKNGDILAAGSIEEISELKGSTTVSIDLKGKTLLPGFIDAHSHIMMGVQLSNQANLSSPPVAGIESINDMIVALKLNQAELDVDKGDWIVGWGYDPDLIAEGRHPNKFDLDEHFPDHPVFLLHVSGHLGVLNSKGLELMGFNSETPDPKGGQIMRINGTSEPNGLVAESVMHIVNDRLPKVEIDEAQDLIDKTFNLYMSNGITTANDGFSTPEYINLMEELSHNKSFPIDVISLVGFRDMEPYLADKNFKWKRYENGLKYAGVKIITDGSPQGKTAKMRDPYLTQVPGCTDNCRGIGFISQEQTDQLLQLLYGRGIQVYAHCNGDGAIDMFLNGHDKAINTHNLNSEDLRTVIIHSQFMRPDLVEQYAHYQLIPSYFTNHTFFWGDVHMNNMGEERAFYTSPLRASKDAGFTYTNHSDYPITPLSPSFMLYSAVNRIARSGAVIGPDQRATIYEALEALTINGAYQYFEEDIKGSLEPGKWADLVILSDNPLTMTPEALKDIEVIETIKKGRTVYSKK